MRTWVPESLVTCSYQQAAESGRKPGSVVTDLSSSPLSQQPLFSCLFTHPPLPCSPSERAWGPLPISLLSQAKASAQCFPGEWEFSLSFSRYTFWGCWSSPRHCRLEKLPQGDLTRWPPGGSEVWTARLSRPGSQEWWLSTLAAH